jgi:anti-anti-sigma factor
MGSEEYKPKNNQEVKELGKKVYTWISRGTNSIKIDLSNIIYIDGASVSTILYIRKRLAKRRMSLEILNPNAQVRQIFEFKDLTYLLAQEKTEANNHFK